MTSKNRKALAKKIVKFLWPVVKASARKSAEMWVEDELRGKI